MADCEALQRRFAHLRTDRVSEGRGPYVCRDADHQLYELDPGGREPLGLAHKDKICDGAAYDPSSRHLCFFELKSKWSKEADQQLGTVVSAWKRQRCPQVRVVAALVMSGSAPRKQPQQARRFRKQHKVPLVTIQRSGRKGNQRAVRTGLLFDG